MTIADENDSANEMRLGTLEVRLARDAAELRRAQQLRYRVFYQEMQAQASPEVTAEQRDFDALDDYCDHLLVLDNARPPEDNIVGTYRLIRRSAAKKFGKFYSSDEYDITCLLNYPGEILELGRSCVAPDYRARSTMQLMWSGLAAYVFQHDIAIMFGCGSLPGCDPMAHKEALSYLYYHHLAPPSLRPRALPERYVDMRLLPPESVHPEHGLEQVKVDPRLGGSNLPPLIKGYLRVGASFGEHAVIDRAFNTTDVLVILPVERINPRYIDYFGAEADRFAA